MKTNDIHVCAFPKSGITYFGFLLVAARLHHDGIDLVPTMYNIDFLLIDTHKMGTRPAGSLWRDGIGDLYKTHLPYLNVPNVIYVLREPVATLRSYFHFRRSLGSTDSAQQFLTGPEGIAGWIHHVKSWLLDNHNVSQSLFVTEYERLRGEPAAELRALGQQLGLTLSDEAIAAALAAASLTRMRESEAAFAARNPVYARFDLEFVRRGERRIVEQITPELSELIRAQTQPVYEAARSRLQDRAAGARAGEAA